MIFHTPLSIHFSHCLPSSLLSQLSPVHCCHLLMFDHLALILIHTSSPIVSFFPPFTWLLHFAHFHIVSSYILSHHYILGLHRRLFSLLLFPMSHPILHLLSLSLLKPVSFLDPLMCSHSCHISSTQFHSLAQSFGLSQIVFYFPFLSLIFNLSVFYFSFLFSHPLILFPLTISHHLTVNYSLTFPLSC